MRRGRALEDQVAWTTDLEALCDCDPVVEDNVEDPKVKGEVFHAWTRCSRRIAS